MRPSAHDRPLDPEETSAIVTDYSRTSHRVSPPPGVPLGTLLKERTMDHKDSDLDRLADFAEQHCLEFERRYHYSGRGMNGKVSKLAFACHIAPYSKPGKHLLDGGLSYDQLGTGWIYFSRATQETP